MYSNEYAFQYIAHHKKFTNIHNANNTDQAKEINCATTVYINNDKTEGKTIGIRKIYNCIYAFQ